eukprot:1483450-Rhodomonas_salina.1
MALEIMGEVALQHSVHTTSRAVLPECDLVLFLLGQVPVVEWVVVVAGGGLERVQLLLVVEVRDLVAAVNRSDPDSAGHRSGGCVTQLYSMSYSSMSSITLVRPSAISNLDRRISLMSFSTSAPSHSPVNQSASHPTAWWRPNMVTPPTLQHSYGG